MRVNVVKQKEEKKAAADAQKVAASNNIRGLGKRTITTPDKLDNSPVSPKRPRKNTNLKKTPLKNNAYDVNMTLGAKSTNNCDKKDEGSITSSSGIEQLTTWLDKRFDRFQSRLDALEKGI